MDDQENKKKESYTSTQFENNSRFSNKIKNRQIARYNNSLLNFNLINTIFSFYLYLIKT